MSANRPIASSSRDQRGKSIDVAGSLCAKQVARLLYLEVIQFLGNRSFDEYKIMGSPPYGNPRPTVHPAQLL